MKKRHGLFAILAALAILLLPAGAFAEEPEIEPFLARLDSRKIKTTENSIVITDGALSKAGVGKVTFDDKELAIRIHYTVTQDGDSVVIKFQPRYLSRQESGKHEVRIEFVEHSAETVFQIGEADLDVAAEPPRAMAPGA